MKKKVFLISALILVIAIGALYMLLPKNIQVLRSGITSKANATGSGTETDPWDISADSSSNVVAYLSEDGTTLTISGNGSMKGETYSYSMPWEEYKSQITNVVIEDGVTNIGADAFKDHIGLTSVVMSNSVYRISESAFAGCENLTNIELSNGLKNIEASAFVWCKSLNNITIPTGVTKIEQGTFCGCDSLTEIIIPSTVTDIGKSAFLNCSKLEKVELSEVLNNIRESAFSNCGSLIEITIPSTVTNIGKSAFGYCRKLEKVELQEGLTNIGENAFEHCEGLIEITIPSTITDISANAFAYSGLTKVEILDGVQNICGRAFDNCYSLTEVVMPNSIKTIGASAFNRCYKLGTITFSENLETIGQSAFAYTDFTKIEIPLSVSVIETWAFEACDSLTEAIINGDIQNHAFSRCTNLSKVTIGNGTEIIESSAFALCSNIVEVSISENVKDIAGNAFKDCEKLEEIQVHEDNKYYTNYDGVLYKVGDNNELTEIVYFPSTKEVTQYVIPHSVKIIGEYSFEGCENLEEIILPEDLTEIGDLAFYRCYKLATIKIPDGVTSLGESAFSACYGLKAFDIPDSVETAGEGLLLNSCLTIPVAFTSSEKQNGETEREIEIPNVLKRGMTEGDILNSEDEIISFENCTLVEDENKIKVKYNDLQNAQISIKNNIDWVYTPLHGFTIKFEEAVALESLQIKEQATNKDYKVGENFDKTGLIIEATYENGDTKTIEDYTILNGENLQYGQESVTISYYEAGITKTVQQPISVLKAQGNISNIQDLSKTYDKQAVAEPTYDKVGEGQVFVEWYKVENGTEMSLNEAPTNVGNYKVKVIMAEGTNYTGAELEKTFTIDKATYDMSGVSFTDATYAYDGTEKSIVIDGTLPEGVSVTYQGNTKTDVGESLVTAMFTGDIVNYNEIPNMTATLTISAMQGSISNITDLSKTYDGYQVSNPNFNRGGDGEVTFEWYSMDGNTETRLDNAPTNAGAYKVKVIMSSTTNYSGAELDKEFIISKATYDMSNVSFVDARYVYDGTEKKIEISGTLPEGVNVRYENNTGTNAGEYNATVIFTGDSTNYNTIENKTAKLTIVKAQGNISSISDISKTYDGVTVAELTYDKIGDGQVTIEWYKLEATVPTKLDTAPINAGKYKVKIILAESENYTSAESERIFTINKVNPAYTVLTGLTAIEGEKLSSINLPEGFSWQQDLETCLEQIGENKYTVTYIPQDTENYNIVTGIEVTVTVIEKPEIDLGDYVETKDEQTGRIYIENIDQNTTVDQIKEKLGSNGEVEIYKSEDKVEGADTKIGTGMEVRITLENNQTVTYQAVVKGDATGDGVADISDLVLLARYVAKTDKNVENIKLRAMEVNNNDGRNTVDMSDLVIMARYVARKIDKF